MKAKSSRKPRAVTNYSVKSARLLLDSGEIDGRSSVARALAELRRNLIASLGGDAGLSEQQTLLVGIAARTALLLDSLDNYLFSLDSLVNRKHRRAYAIVEQRGRLADSLLRQLQALGLRRLPRPVESLQEYLARTYPEKASPDDQESRGERTDEEPLEVGDGDPEPAEVHDGD